MLPPDTLVKAFRGLLEELWGASIFRGRMGAILELRFDGQHRRLALVKAMGRSAVPVVAQSIPVTALDPCQGFLPLSAF